MSPAITAHGKVKEKVYQFNAHGGGLGGRGSNALRGRGRGCNDVYCWVDMDSHDGHVKANTGNMLMLVDQETQNKKRHSASEPSVGSKEDSRDFKKKRALECNTDSVLAEAAAQSRQSQ